MEKKQFWPFLLVIPLIAAAAAVAAIVTIFNFAWNL